MLAASKKRLRSKQGELMPTRKIEDFLADNHQRFTPLQKLLNQDRSRDAWTQELRAVLPKALAGHCQVTDLQGSSLLISCRSAAIATKLRFLAPNLVPKLRALGHFSALTDLQIRVAN